MHARAVLDRVEQRLGSLASRLARPRTQALAVAAIVLLGLLVRLPLALQATDVVSGHGDSYIFFHQAATSYLAGDVYPDAHRGSGWQLLLAGVLHLFDVEPIPWTAYGEPLEGEAARAASIAHALSAVLAAGVVAATFLLARATLPPAYALLAALLVALDPFLLSTTTSAMSEPPYLVLFTLATLTVLHARRHPAWLLATGALMALGHVLRINGLVMFVALLAFAVLLLRPRLAWRRLAPWAAAGAVVFLLVAAPYLAWRAEHLPHAFDYGTNQRFWSDELWDLHDPYWTNYSTKEGGPRETMGDWWAKHTWRDAANRLWESVQWQLFDLFGVGKWPPLEPEGGRWVGTRPDGSALTPLVVALSLVGALTALPRRRDLWVVPVALAFTFATFVWIYPLVRSVRYFSPLIPLFTILALVGWQRLAQDVRWPRLVGTALFGTHLLLYGGRLVTMVPGAVVDGWALAEVRTLFLAGAAVWLALALAPLLVRRWRAAPAAAEAPSA